LENQNAEFEEEKWGFVSEFISTALSYDCEMGQQWNEG
jgi:hypothetical protein